MAGDLAGAKEFYEAGAAAGSVDWPRQPRERVPRQRRRGRGGAALPRGAGGRVPSRRRRRTSRGCSRRGAATRARARPRSCCGTWCGRTRRGGTPHRRTWGARSPTRAPRSSTRSSASSGASRGPRPSSGTRARRPSSWTASAGRREVHYGLRLADLNSDQRFEAYGDGEVLLDGVRREREPVRRLPGRRRRGRRRDGGERAAGRPRIEGGDFLLAQHALDALATRARRRAGRASPASCARSSTTSRRLLMISSRTCSSTRRPSSSRRNARTSRTRRPSTRAAARGCWARRSAIVWGGSSARTSARTWSTRPGSSAATTRWWSATCRCPNALYDEVFDLIAAADVLGGRLSGDLAACHGSGTARSRAGRR